MSIGMSAYPADRLINVLKALIGVNRDADLAEAFGIGKSTVASWRKRGFVPDAIIERAKVEFGYTDRFAQEQVEGEEGLGSVLVGNAYFYSILRLGAVLNEAEIARYAALLHTHSDLIRAKLKQAASPKVNSGGGDAITMFSDVSAGRLLGPDELKAVLTNTVTPAETVPH